MPKPNEEIVKKVRKVFAEMVVVVNQSNSTGDVGGRLTAAAILTQTYFTLEDQRQADFTPP